MKEKNSSEKQVIARSLLKNSHIRIEVRNGKSVFVIPDGLANLLQQQYNFNFDQLKVGGDLSLHELALHMDEQASIEAWASSAAELARILLEHVKQDYERWYESKCHKVREYWHKTYKKFPTGPEMSGYMYNKYGVEMNEQKRQIIDLEGNYRILNNVIKNAIAVKGDMLRSMRPLLQPDGVSVNGIDVKVADQTRMRLIVNGDQDGKEKGVNERSPSEHKESKDRKGKQAKKG